MNSNFLFENDSSRRPLLHLVQVLIRKHLLREYFIQFCTKRKVL